MNLGLALTKPGESDLGIAGRLWMANQHSWHLDSTSLNSRIASTFFTASCYEPSDTSVTGVASLRRWEHIRFPDRPLAQLPSYINYIPKTRHCVSCALEGYHSLYFDTLWFNECPVHGEELVQICPGCSKSWPKSDTIHKRLCDVCGIRKKSNAAKNFEMFTTQDYLPIEELDLFFSNSINEATYCRKTDLMGRSVDLDSYTRTLNYPSLVAAHFYTEYQEWLETLPFSKHLKPLAKKKIRIDTQQRASWSGEISNVMLRKMTSIRQDILDSIFNHEHLEDIAKEARIECREDDAQIFSAICVEYFSRIIDRARRPLYFSWVDHKDYFAPKLITNIYDTKQDRRLNVPQNIQLFLYRLDLQFEVKRVQAAALNSCIDNSYEPSRESPCRFLTWRKRQANFNAYSFVIEPDGIHLYYPEEYEWLFTDDFESWLLSDKPTGES